MRKIIGLGIAICLAMLLIAPVAACHVSLLTKTGPADVCPTCEYYEYTITAASSDGTALRVNDTLPSSLAFISSSPSPTTIVGQTLSWDFPTPGYNSPVTITVRVKPVITTGPISNIVSARVKTDPTHWTGIVDTRNYPAITNFNNEICPIPSPEFPTQALPVGLIIGMLGVVLFIRKTKE
jgi:hypothetical protein